MRRALLIVAAVTVVATGCGAGDDGDAGPAAGRRASVESAAQEPSSVTPSSGSVLAPTSGSSPMEPTTPAVPHPASPPPTGASATHRHRFLPEVGTYVYDVTGYHESGNAPTRRREEVAGAETDEVVHRAAEVTVMTTDDDGSRQEAVYRVGSDGVTLNRLVLGAITVVPDPPIPMARLPYAVGAAWEFAWRDDAAGLRGAGNGKVVREEELAGIRVFVVVHDQRVEGLVSGRVQTTVWVDSVTGRHLKQHVVSEMQQGATPYRSDITRVLRL